MPPACRLQQPASRHPRLQAVVNQDTVGDLRALQLENARLQRELAKKEVGGVGSLFAGNLDCPAVLSIHWLAGWLADNCILPSHAPCRAR